jgi:UDP-N-acetylglucosamine--N-acetylmuramyl-(pentapeptide) pyrophosphoryl-undecaprenol N-acetylglucosamine transferase
MKTVFLAGGRTGGPLLPLITLFHELDEYMEIIVGVNNGFEHTYAAQKQKQFLPLLDARLRSRSFQNTNSILRLQNVFWDALSMLCFGVNIVLALYYIFRYKPNGICSAGGFSAVPLVFAANVWNKLPYTQRVKIIVHQQDPIPGLANKLTAKYADVLTCVFASTQKYPHFQYAKQVPNPIPYSALHKDNVHSIEDKDIRALVIAAKKPLLLVFGGGSGSQSINTWVKTYKTEITTEFAVVHITGALRDEERVNEKDYVAIPALFDDMPRIMSAADIVICRAGLGSISELTYLHKPAYLIPLPSSHQEANAREVKDLFYVFDEKDISTLLSTIQKTYPKWFELVTYPAQKDIVAQLQNYYQMVREALDKE